MSFGVSEVEVLQRVAATHAEGQFGSGKRGSCEVQLLLLINADIAFGHLDSVRVIEEVESVYLFQVPVLREVDGLLGASRFCCESFPHDNLALTRARHKSLVLRFRTHREVCDSSLQVEQLLHEASKYLLHAKGQGLGGHEKNGVEAALFIAYEARLQRGRGRPQRSCRDLGSPQLLERRK